MSRKKAGWILLDVETAGAASAKLCDFLLGNIRGQDAVRDVADAMEIRDGEFQEDDKPIYKGLCLGPSGVGKTLFAEMLALFFFKNRRGFTRIACDTFSEPHAIARLIGSPPGYVGYNEPPIFTQENIDKWAVPANEKEQSKKNNQMIGKGEKELRDSEEAILRMIAKKYFGNPNKQEEDSLDKIIKVLIVQRDILLNRLEALKSRTSELLVKNPLSIILFDEVEKASPTLHNTILNILDKAELTLANGDITRFNNSIILMTSNAGSGDIADLMKKSRKRKIGFEIEESDKKLNKNQDQLVYETAMEAAYREFLPEFLARFDRISVFRPLSPKTLAEIYDLELRKFREKYLDRLFLKLDVSEPARQFIIKEATDKPANGARLIKEKIYKYLKRQIARLKNRKEFLPGDTVYVLLGPPNSKGKPAIEFYKESPVLIGSPSGTPPK